MESIYIRSYVRLLRTTLFHLWLLRHLRYLLEKRMGGTSNFVQYLLLFDEARRVILFTVVVDVIRRQ
jgi:hypothetical protein